MITNKTQKLDIAIQMAERIVADMDHQEIYNYAIDAMTDSFMNMEDKDLWDEYNEVRPDVN